MKEDGVLILGNEGSLYIVKWWVSVDYTGVN